MRPLELRVSQSNEFVCGINNSKINRTFSNTELNYSHYLHFNVSIRTNQFVYSQTDKYTPQQQELQDYIKSMHDRGMSYKRITKLLNEKNITTHKGKKWGASGNSVYSVLMKYQQRLKRIEFQNKEYEPQWSKMEVKWEKNN